MDLLIPTSEQRALNRLEIREKITKEVAETVVFDASLNEYTSRQNNLLKDSEKD